MEGCDLFMETSSDDSDFRPFECPRIKDVHALQQPQVKAKIEEIIPISDSDSENFGTKSSLVDLTYEQFIARKKQLTNKEKTAPLKEKEASFMKGREVNVDEKILELKKEFSFERASHKTEKARAGGKGSSEGKIQEKFREIVNESKSSKNNIENKTKEKSLSKSRSQHANKDLEDLRRTNHELRKKLTSLVNPKENSEKLREEVLIEKIEKMRSRLNTLITVKRASKDQEKDQQAKNSRKPRNFLKDSHCSNCAKLLSKGIPTHFCPVHGKAPTSDPPHYQDPKTSKVY